MGTVPALSLLHQKLRDRPRWNQLRGVGNSIVSKSTVAIPILGYMLLFNEEVVRYLKLHHDFCNYPSCGPSWRLHFFYFGCCFVALGSAIYAALCPPLIKKYRDAAAFFDFEKAFLSHSTSLAHLFLRIEHAKGSSASDPLDLKSMISRNTGLTLDQIGMLAGPMSEHYYLENRSRASARIATFLAYSIGGLLLLWPTAVTAWQIVQIVYRTL